MSSAFATAFRLILPLLTEMARYIDGRQKKCPVGLKSALILRSELAHERAKYRESVTLLEKEPIDRDY